jgi:hypothetical protein
MLATVVASGLYVLFGPIFNVVYPRMSAQYAAGDSKGLLATYKQGTLALSSVLFPIVILAAVLSEELLFAWTGNRTLARNVGPIVSLAARRHGAERRHALPLCPAARLRRHAAASDDHDRAGRCGNGAADRRACR